MTIIVDVFDEILTLHHHESDMMRCIRNCERPSTKRIVFPCAHHKQGGDECSGNGESEIISRPEGRAEQAKLLVALTQEGAQSEPQGRLPGSQLPGPAPSLHALQEESLKPTDGERVDELLGGSQAAPLGDMGHSTAPVTVEDMKPQPAPVAADDSWFRFLGGHAGAIAAESCPSMMTLLSLEPLQADETKPQVVLYQNAISRSYYGDMSGRASPQPLSTARPSPVSFSAVSPQPQSAVDFLRPFFQLESEELLQDLLLEMAEVEQALESEAADRLPPASEGSALQSSASWEAGQTQPGQCWRMAMRVPVSLAPLMEATGCRSNPRTTDAGSVHAAAAISNAQAPTKRSSTLPRLYIMSETTASNSAQAISVALRGAPEQVLSLVHLAMDSSASSLRPDAGHVDVNSVCGNDCSAPQAAGQAGGGDLAHATRSGDEGRLAMEGWSDAMEEQLKVEIPPRGSGPVAGGCVGGRQPAGRSSLRGSTARSEALESAMAVQRRSPLGRQASRSCGGSPIHRGVADAEDVDSRSRNGIFPKETACETCWHEVVVTPLRHPEDGRRLFLITQTDVTVRTQLEMAMSQVSDAQLNMLNQIFPQHVLEFLVAGGTSSQVPKEVGRLARSHEQASVLFMDIVGFTNMSKQVSPVTVMTFLNELFSIFDDLATLHGVQKVETAGDCYIVAAGILVTQPSGSSQVRDWHDPRDSAARVLAFAKDMLISSRLVSMPHDGTPVVIRIGIHSGPCVSGLICSKLPKFSIFGDTMNTASRMESTCMPGRIQLSATTHQLLMSGGSCCTDELEATGGVEVKSKGMMETYLWRESGATLVLASPLFKTMPSRGLESSEAALLLASPSVHTNLVAPAVPADGNSGGNGAAAATAVLAALLPLQLQESMGLPSPQRSELGHLMQVNGTWRRLCSSTHSEVHMSGPNITIESPSVMPDSPIVTLELPSLTRNCPIAACESHSVMHASNLQDSSMGLDALHQLDRVSDTISLGEFDESSELERQRRASLVPAATDAAATSSDAALPLLSTERHVPPLAPGMPLQPQRRRRASALQACTRGRGGGGGLSVMHQSSGSNTTMLDEDPQLWPPSRLSRPRADAWLIPGQGSPQARLDSTLSISSSQEAKHVASSVTELRQLMHMYKGSETMPRQEALHLLPQAPLLPLQTGGLRFDRRSSVGSGTDHESSLPVASPTISPIVAMAQAMSVAKAALMSATRSSSKRRPSHVKAWASPGLGNGCILAGGSGGGSQAARAGRGVKSPLQEAAAGSLSRLSQADQPP